MLPSDSPSKLINTNFLPNISKPLIKYLSGMKTHPPKKPFTNLAKISSSVKLPTSFLESVMDRESENVAWFLGFTIRRECEDETDGERVGNMFMVLVLDAGRRRWLR